MTKVTPHDRARAIDILKNTHSDRSHYDNARIALVKAGLFRTTPEAEQFIREEEKIGSIIRDQPVGGRVAKPCFGWKRGA